MIKKNMKQFVFYSSIISTSSLFYVHALMNDCNNHNLKFGIEKESCMVMNYVKEKN